MNKLVQLDKSVLDREEAKEVTKVYSTLKAASRGVRVKRSRSGAATSSFFPREALPLTDARRRDAHIAVNSIPRCSTTQRDKYFLLGTASARIGPSYLCPGGNLQGLTR